MNKKRELKQFPKIDEVRTTKFCPPLWCLPISVNKKPKVGRETLHNKLVEVKLRRVTGPLPTL